MRLRVECSIRGASFGDVFGTALVWEAKKCIGGGEILTEEEVGVAEAVLNRRIRTEREAD